VSSIKEKKLIIDYSLSQQQIDQGMDVVEGLTKSKKSLPPHYFYDAKGSLLFEAICQLPEYYPTRTEAEILSNYAPEIAEITGNCELLELGSGSSTKTRLLLDAYGNLDSPLHYVAIDISHSILEASLEELLQDYPHLKVTGLASTYEVALKQLQPPELPKRMIFFLGSTMGNFNPQECDRFFSLITKILRPGDYFLLGIDLQKPQNILEAAYNDRQGITAAFNLNMLEHLNQRFQCNFDLNLFQHRAFYNSYEHQIEMHLVAKQAHSVRLEKLDLTVEFQGGETILTEISRKFNLEQMSQYLKSWGLPCVNTWHDSNNWFALLLSQRV
jgi:dimethylhistidine N-methyltransferase